MDKLHEQANQEFKLKNYQRAIDIYSKIEPKNEKIYNNLALCYFHLQKFQISIQEAEKSIKVNKNFIKAYYTKGLSLENLGKTGKAREIYERALQIENNNEIRKRMNEIDKKVTFEMMDQEIKEDDQEETHLLNMISKMIPKNSYYDVPNFVQEFQKTNPNKEDLDFITNVSKTRGTYSFIEHFIDIDNICKTPDFLYKRFGNSSESFLNWLKKANPGDVFSSNIITHSSFIKYNFSNSEKWNHVLTPGKVTVSFGFVDLSIFLNWKIDSSKKLSEFNPIIFVGYEASLFSVIKTKLIIEMIHENCDTISILQVWLSSGWSKKTMNEFLKIADKMLQKPLDKDEIKYLESWKNFSCSRKESKALWKKTHPVTGILGDGLCNLRNEKDRVDYCKYWASGEIFSKDIEFGSSIMFSKDPFDYLVCDNESFYQMFPYMYLKYKDTLLSTLESHLIDSINLLKQLTKDKHLIFEINHKYITLQDRDLLENIKKRDPWVITWSNIPDYFKPKDFLNMATLCSSENSIHYFESMNWSKYVFGINIIDYPEKNRKEMLKSSKETLRKVNFLSNIFKDQFYAHPYSISGYILTAHYYMNWVNNFFQGFQKNLLLSEMSQFNPLRRNYQVLFISFTFNTNMDMNLQTLKIDVCFYCKKEGDLKYCSKCHLTKYCSKECQKKDWKSHSLICKGL